MLESIVASILRALLDAIFGALKISRDESEDDRLNREAGARAAADSLNQETIDALKRIAEPPPDVPVDVDDFVRRLRDGDLRL